MICQTNDDANLSLRSDRLVQLIKEETSRIPGHGNHCAKTSLMLIVVYAMADVYGSMFCTNPADGKQWPML